MYTYNIREALHIKKKRRRVMVRCVSCFIYLIKYTIPG